MPREGPAHVPLSPHCSCHTGGVYVCAGGGSSVSRVHACVCLCEGGVGVWNLTQCCNMSVCVCACFCVPEHLRVLYIFILLLLELARSVLGAPPHPPHLRIHTHHSQFPSLSLIWPCGPGLGQVSTTRAPSYLIFHFFHLIQNHGWCMAGAVPVVWLGFSAAQ